MLRCWFVVVGPHCTRPQQPLAVGFSERSPLAYNALGSMGDWERRVEVRADSSALCGVFTYVEHRTNRTSTTDDTDDTDDTTKPTKPTTPTTTMTPTKPTKPATPVTPVTPTKPKTTDDTDDNDDTDETDETDDTGDTDEIEDNPSPRECARVWNRTGSAS